MKLLSTIASALISISAFSQDFIEYNNFTFSHNGEEIQMEDIEKMTKSYSVGKANLNKARRYLLLTQKRNLEITSNSLHLLGGVATGFVSFLGIWVGVNFLTPPGPGGGLTLPNENSGGSISLYEPSAGRAFIALGTVTGSTAIYLFSKIGNRKAFELRADKQFKKVADKFNEAINQQGIEKLQKVIME